MGGIGGPGGSGGPYVSDWLRRSCRSDPKIFTIPKSFMIQKEFEV